MRKKLPASVIIGVMTATAGAVVNWTPATTASAQAPAASGTTPAPATSLKTAWGEPDLQGIWTDETTTPLQRPAKYVNQEFFTAAERAELDKVRWAARSREAGGARDRARCLGLL